jgi:PadR family transcriptional regulator PadR
MVEYSGESEYTTVQVPIERHASVMLKGLQRVSKSALLRRAVDVERYICRIRHMQARSLSYAATAVLEAVAQGHQYGFDVIAVTGLASGTVYPALRRLEDAGYVESRWEDQRLAQREVRPVRKYYEVTESGQAALAAALLRYRALGRRRRRSARVLRPSRA